MSDFYERNECKIWITQDMDPESPRDWDNLGVMICSHRNYNLGDEQFSSSDYEGWEDLKKYLYKERDAAIVLPLGLYDHSGITMYVGENHDRWDGGQVGFIYMTNEVFKENYDYADQEEATKQATEYLKGEVKTYAQYLEGDVWGFNITNKYGEDVDSCWGFYGTESAEEEANSVADSYKQPRDAARAKNAFALHR